MTDLTLINLVVGSMMLLFFAVLFWIILTLHRLSEAEERRAEVRRDEERAANWKTFCKHRHPIIEIRLYGASDPEHYYWNVAIGNYQDYDGHALTRVPYRWEHIPLPSWLNIRGGNL
jgi:hypothetical protein